MDEIVQEVRRASSYCHGKGLALGQECVAGFLFSHTYSVLAVAVERESWYLSPTKKKQETNKKDNNNKKNSKRAEQQISRK